MYTVHRPNARWLPRATIMLAFALVAWSYARHAICRSRSWSPARLPIPCQNCGLLMNMFKYAVADPRHTLRGTHLVCEPQFENYCAAESAKRRVPNQTRSSADADKPARRVWRSVKVTKHSTIPYVRYSFLLCNSNFVFKTRRFYDIRLQKSRDLEMGVKGHSRLFRVVSLGRVCMVSY